MRSTKRTSTDLSAASGMSQVRLDEWLNADTVQLDLTEQPLVMKVVGLKESDLPEIMIHDFRKNGYVPEVLLNFLALQGWSPGGDLEHMTMNDMVEKFSLDRIISSNPKFNREKLKSFSTDFFAKAPVARLSSAMRDYLSVNPASPLNSATDDELNHVLAMNAGFHVLSEVDEKSRFFFIADEAVVYDAASVDKVLIKSEKQGLNALKQLREVFAGLAEWTAHSTESAVKTFCETTQLGLGKVAQPVRVAVCGSSVSPPIFESLQLLGRARTLARIDRCVALYS